MKLIRLFLIASISLIVGACAQSSKSMPPPLDCSNPGNHDVRMTLTYAAGNLKVVPPKIRACPDHMLIINFSGSAGAEKVKTVANAKINPGSNWLDKNATKSDRRIEIPIPPVNVDCPPAKDENGIPDTNGDVECKFDISVDGVGTLDPRVTVRY